jgi:hypothetical protein
VELGLRGLFIAELIPGDGGFANSKKIPAMFDDSVYVEAGWLMSYGPDYRGVFQKAAIFVDKIF